jgi:hypothetical protein
MIDMKKNQDPASFDDHDHSSILSDKIGLPFHAPDEWQKIIPPKELERLVKTGDQVGIHVLVGDIRRSTFLM